MTLPTFSEEIELLTIQVYYYLRFIIIFKVCIRTSEAVMRGSSFAQENVEICYLYLKCNESVWRIMKYPNTIFSQPFYNTL